MTALGIATTLRGDARALPLPDASVDLVVTSPPYFALRSYTDGGEQYAGQIGAEPTPQEYIASLIDCTREWVRVLKPGGSCWVNLGDKYGRPGGGADRNPRTLDRAGRGTTARLRTGTDGGGRDKSLMLLPERYRIACVDQLDLIARAVVIWDKPNGLPESVTDRVRRSHEDWVHLTEQPRYFSAVDEIREPHAASTVLRAQPHRAPVTGTRAAYQSMPAQTIQRDQSMHTLGALPGSVWEIPTEPLKVPDHIAHARCCNGVKRPGCEDGVDHFAAYPTEWPRRIILGWSPSGICTACGEGRRPRVNVEHELYRAAGSTGRPKQQLLNGSHAKGRNGAGYPQTRTTATIAGYICACTPYTDHPATGERHRNSTGAHGNHRAHDGDGPASRPSDLDRAAKVGAWREYHLDGWAPAPIRPAVVLDPFGGTGTTALVAKALGRQGISVDRSADYCRLAQWRTTDPGQLAKAMRVDKPAAQMDGQLDLLDLDGDAA